MIDLEKPTAEETKPAAKESVPASIHTFELQSAAPLPDAQHYQLDELLRYHDRLFVTQAFLAILKRPPAEVELAARLDDLRTGRRTKVELLTDLTSAVPPSAQRVEIAGLKPPGAKGISDWPVVGYFARVCAGVARLPQLVRDLQRFEVYSMAQQQRMADYMNEVILPACGGQALIDLLDTISMLSDSVINLGAQIDSLHQTQLHQAQIEIELQKAVDGQQEFLINEQRVIVETQKVVLADLQTQINDLLAQQKLKHEELATAVQELKGLLASGTNTGAVTPRDQTPGASA